MSDLCRATTLACVLALALAPACAKSEADWRAELAHRDPFVRALAAIALVEVAPERAAAALPVLLETVDRPSLGLRAAVDRELARLAPRVREALVVALVRDDFLTLDRRAAIESALLSAGAPAAETIVAALRGGARVGRDDLAELLVRLGPAAVAPLEEIAFEPIDAELAVLVARTLGGIGRPALRATAALRAMAQRPEEAVSSAARAALAAIDAAAVEVR